MSKHTPGPWLQEGMTVYALNDERSPVNRFSARVDSGWLNETTRVSKEELEANARLIAAAPELLEALEMVMRVGRIDDNIKAMDQVAEVIAKARGI